MWVFDSAAFIFMSVFGTVYFMTGWVIFNLFLLFEIII